MRHKYSTVILQTLGGASQQDFEYEKKLQDFKQSKKNMVTLKKVIDSFPKQLEGVKLLLDKMIGVCELIYDKDQKGYFQFMHNVSSAHKALENKFVGLINQFNQLSNATNSWVAQINDIASKCKLREQCRQNYEHYEQKLYELNNDRVKEIRKKK